MKGRGIIFLIDRAILGDSWTPIWRNSLLWKDHTAAIKMDFLKSAVVSAISKGPVFPFSFDDRVDIDNSIWTLHHGTKRVRPCSKRKVRVLR
jgi:SCY1-like protein 1